MDINLDIHKILFEEVMNTMTQINVVENLSMSTDFERHLLKLLPTFFNYQEEEVSIKPKVIVSKNIDKLIIPIISKSKIKLGRGSLNGKSLKKNLKSLLPFCNAGWIVYFDISDDYFEYGILRAYSRIDGYNTEEQLFLDNSDSIKDASMIYIKLLNKFELYIKGKNGTNTIIDLRFHEENFTSAIENIDNLNNDLLSKVSDKHNKQITAIKKILEKLVEKSKGSILVIVDKNCVALPDDLFTDGVWLDNPIDLNQIYMDLTDAKGANDALDTNEKFFALTNLFYEMANIDGAVILNNLGQILGYNCFIRTSQTDGLDEVSGGARMRAFQSLKLNNSGIIVGILFISQDGEVSYESVGNKNE